jgi:5-enolpyruvylshikimate-3-phosphate synthase
LIKELNYLIDPDRTIDVRGEVNVSGSKSESNRLLILQSLFPGISLNNLSNSDDTRYLGKALESNAELIDISHAGTAMRFLTAYFSSREGREVVLTGSDRMQNRPIGILVDALRELGADISYEDKEGYPPLRIRGRKLLENEVSIQGNVSSQYISVDNGFAIDPSLILDASIGYQMEHWRLRLNLKNLTNADYETRGFGATSVLPGNPLAVYLGVDFTM